MRNPFAQTMLYFLLLILVLISMGLDSLVLVWLHHYLHRIVAAVHWCAMKLMNLFFIA